MSDALDLIQRARIDAATIIEHLLGAPNRRLSNARETRWRNHGSFRFAPLKGVWKDYETGEYGDALDLIQRECSLDRKAAIKWLADWYGGGDLAPIDHEKRRREIEAAEKADAEARQRRFDAAKRFWTESVSLVGTPGEVYLRGRIGADIPAEAFKVLRWHPRPLMKGELAEGGEFPAIVAKMTDPLTGAGTGVHRTFVDPVSCSKVEKKMLGVAGVVRLNDPEARGEPMPGLAIGEGIETSLAASIRYDFPIIWACLSAGAIGRFPVLHETTEALTIFADNDASGTGERQANVCADRWCDAGREVTIAKPKTAGTDIADLQTGRAA